MMAEANRWAVVPYRDGGSLSMIHVLAQSGTQSKGGLFGEGAAPPELPAPPWLVANIFEAPWVLVCVLLLVGMAGYFVLRASRPREALVCGAVGPGLALLVAVLSFAVTTEREKLARLADGFVASIARADAEAVGAQLLDSATLRLMGRDTNWSKPDLVMQVESKMKGMYAVKNRQATVSRVSVSVDGENVARTQFRVAAVSDSMGWPVGMWWLMHWRKEAASGRGGEDVWRVSGMELLSVDGLSPGAEVRP